jgi:hydrogenase maturation protein HypF
MRDGGTAMSAVERRVIRLRGRVQGVGFRQSVAWIAARYHVAGFVRNDGADVLVDVEAAPAELDRFVVDLLAHPPPLARIDAHESRHEPPLGRTGFAVAPTWGR